MRIAVAADHRGFPYKGPLIETLGADGHDVTDLGTDSTAPVDYPDYAKAVGTAVRDGRADVGVVVCGSGAGVSIAANKLRGVRAALCHDLFTARQAREDDDANVLCLGAGVVDLQQATALARAFAAARFSHAERHERRLAKVLALEASEPVTQSGGRGAPRLCRGAPSAGGLGGPFEAPHDLGPLPGRPLMDVGFVGLGRMGGNMVARLLGGGHRVVAYDRATSAVEATARAGATAARSIPELVAALAPPRAVWVMVPAGEPTESTIRELGESLGRDDTIIDGGNTHYKDDVRRAGDLGARGIAYVDAGTSGGVWGLEHGYCLMVGGDAAAVHRLKPVLDTLAPPDGWLHVGGPGAGHYVKMIHNGVEYGMMQAYAEGFELMSVSDYGLDLPRIADLWNRGSVVRSWLLELTADALAADPKLTSLKPWVEDSGEGRWTVADGVEKAVPTPVITASLYARFRSRRENSFADRLLAALRNAFGGHAVRR